MGLWKVMIVTVGKALLYATAFAISACTINYRYLARGYSYYACSFNQRCALYSE